MNTLPEIKWCTTENIDATATWKQHGYVRIEKRTWAGDTYDANGMLCNSNAFITEDETPCNFDDIEYFKTEPSLGACKKCLKIYNNLKNKP